MRHTSLLLAHCAAPDMLMFSSLRYLVHHFYSVYVFSLTDTTCDHVSFNTLNCHTCPLVLRSSLTL